MKSYNSVSLSVLMIFGMAATRAATFSFLVLSDQPGSKIFSTSGNSQLSQLLGGASGFAADAGGTDISISDISLSSSSASSDAFDSDFPIDIILQDDASGESADLPFNVRFGGSASQTTANVTLTPDGPTTQTALLGGTLYTVSLTAYAPPTAPSLESSGSLGRIGAHVTAGLQSATIINSVSLSPVRVPIGGFAMATVTLNGPAPRGGGVLALSGSAGLPQNVLVAEGSTTATFAVPATALGLSSVSVSYNGSTKTASVTVVPQPALSLQLPRIVTSQK